MGEKEILLCVLLGINTIIVLAYLSFNLLRKKRKSRSCLIRGMVMFLCPLAGPVFFGKRRSICLNHKPYIN